MIGPVSEIEKPHHESITGAIWWWNAVSQTYLLVEEGETMKPGRGYWIFVTGDVTIEL